MARDNITFADLVTIAKRVGVRVVEAPSSHRGQHGKMGTVVGCTCHHTGTPNSYKPDLDYTDFNVVKEGRKGLINSLSAFGLGRHTSIYVFSEDISWHAGEWNYKGITDGNGHFLGIEAAGVGDWTKFQLDVYPRLVASILLFIGEGIDMAPRHADGAMPRGRKSDAANFAAIRNKIQFYLDNPSKIPVTASPEEDDDDMPAFTSGWVEPGKDALIAIPPVEAGAAGWGKAWLTLQVDGAGKPGAQNVPIRACIRGANGWRNLVGANPDTTITENKPITRQLVKGDNAVVLTAKGKFPIAYVVEYAK